LNSQQQQQTTTRMLDDLERASVALALEPLVLGDDLGHGQNTSTFSLANDRSKVVKVFRRFALRDVAYQKKLALDGLAPKIFSSKTIGLLDALLVERVVPLDLSEKLSQLETEQLLSLCFRLPSNHGIVNWNLDKTKSLAKTRNQVDPNICMLDTGLCHEFASLRNRLSPEEQAWAGALHAGLCCLQMPNNADLDKNPVFKTFASMMLSGKPKSSAKMTRKQLRDHMQMQMQTAADPVREHTKIETQTQSQSQSQTYKDSLQRGCDCIARILTASSESAREVFLQDLVNLKGELFPADERAA
jgi:hypothetical protein